MKKRTVSRLVYFFVTAILIVSMVIDIIDGNIYKTIGTGFFLAGSLMLVFLYPVTKQFHKYTIIFLFSAAVAVTCYRVFTGVL